jgi:hypothetical protein
MSSGLPPTDIGGKGKRGGSLAEIPPTKREMGAQNQYPVPTSKTNRRIKNGWPSQVVYPPV